MNIVDERASIYGEPTPNMERTAQMWSAYLGIPVTAHDVAMCMILVKVSRSKFIFHEDNYTDIRGYALIASEVHDGRR